MKEIMLSVFQRMSGLYDLGTDPTDLISGFTRGIFMWVYENSQPGEKLANLKLLSDEVNSLIAETENKITEGKFEA
jgi:hypothetical protein